LFAGDYLEDTKTGNLVGNFKYKVSAGKHRRMGKRFNQGSEIISRDKISQNL